MIERDRRSRALWLAVTLQLGCYPVDLDPQKGPPFSCDADAGACPDGYRCQQTLCIPPDGMAPPLPIAASSIEDAAAIPLWNGTNFAVVWQQTDDTAHSGVFLAEVDGPTLGTPVLVLADQTPDAYSAVYEPTSARYVVAVAHNDAVGSALHVFSTTGPGAAITEHLSQAVTYTPYGFSRPALAVRPGALVTVAYTLGHPPDLVADNLYCQRISLTGGATDTGCGPSKAQTNGLFVSEVVVAEFASTTLFAWRGDALYLTLRSAARGGVEKPRIPLPNIVRAEKLLAINPTTGEWASIFQPVPSTPDGGTATDASVADDALSWSLGLSVGPTNGFGAKTRIPSGSITPDVASSGSEYVVCHGNDDNSTSIAVYKSSDDGTALLQQGSELQLPRYSTAPVESCRVVVAPEKHTIGVLWLEQISSATHQIYFGTVPLP